MKATRFPRWGVLLVTIGAGPAFAEGPFYSLDACLSRAAELRMQEPAVYARVRTVGSSEYDAWRAHLRAIEEVGNICSQMRYEQAELAKKEREKESAKDAADRLNEIHEKGSEAFLKRAVPNKTVRGIQEKNLSTVRKGMADSAGRLDDALWSFSKTDFGASQSSATARSGVGNFQGGASSQGSGQKIPNAYSTGTINDWNDRRLASEAATREAEARRVAAIKQAEIANQKRLAAAQAQQRASSPAPENTAPKKRKWTPDEWNQGVTRCMQEAAATHSFSQYCLENFSINSPR